MRLQLRVSIACLVLLAMPAVSAFGQDANSAKAFLQSIYRNYGKGGPGIDFTGPKARRVFDASLIALLQADQRVSGPDEVGVLDGDPVCGCQDWDSLHDLKIAIALLRTGRAKASVSFALFGPEAAREQSVRALEITLAREGGQWRIDNILDKSDPKAPFDLRAELEKEIRESKSRESKSGKRTN